MVGVFSLSKNIEQKVDSYDVYDRVWGNGLSLGYETETYRWLFGASVTGWVFYGDEPFESYATLKFGPHINGFGSSGQILLKSIYHYEDDGSETFSLGPLLYWKFTDEVHGQIEWQNDLYDRQGELDHGDGNRVKIGLGFVY